MNARIDEIAPDLYRISVYVKDFELQFNHFLIKDDEPLLFHTGMRGMFPAAVRRWLHSSILQVSAGSAGATSRWTNAAHSTTGWPLPRRPRRSVVSSAPW